MNNPFYNSFTFKYGKTAKQLSTPVDIIYGVGTYSGEAIWDTGASNTCVSCEVVRALNMIPTGKRTMFTPQGDTVVNTYLVDVVLPNKVIIKDIEVCDSSIDNQGLSMLVGIDIISLGDFTVTQQSNGTVFTFRIPSKAKTDYVQEDNMDNLIGKHGRGKRKKKR